MNKPLQFTEYTGEGKGRGGAGWPWERGLCHTAEGSRGDSAGFVVFSRFISIHTACFVKMSETGLKK